MGQRNNRPAATARIHGDLEYPGICGSVTFTSCRKGMLITAKIKGLPDSDTGFFALHIHEGTNCHGQGFPDTGSHYNPGHVNHPLHAGDLPPLVSCHGEAYLSLLTDRFAVSEVIGRTVVIHSDSDDFRTQPSGNAGTKIACGVIELV